MQSGAGNGQALYEESCVYCHDGDPARLRTPPDQVPALLRSGKVRAHRFELDDAELSALVDYLKEGRRLRNLSRLLGFDEIDADRDGRISEAEMLEAVRGRPRGPHRPPP